MNRAKDDETHLQRIRSGKHNYFCLIEVPSVRCRALESSSIWDVLSSMQFNTLKIDYGSPTYDDFKKYYPAFQLPCVYIFGTRASASPSVVEFSGQNISERQILRYLKKHFDDETNIAKDTDSRNDSTVSLTSSLQPVQPLPALNTGIPTLTPSADEQNPVSPQMAEAFLKLLVTAANTSTPTGEASLPQTTNNNASTSSTTEFGETANSQQHNLAEVPRAVQTGGSTTNSELRPPTNNPPAKRVMPEKCDITITLDEQKSTGINRTQNTRPQRKAQSQKKQSSTAPQSSKDFSKVAQNEDGADPILYNAINMSLSDEVWPTMDADEKEPLIITKAVLRKRVTYIRFGLTFPGGRKEVVKLSPQNQVQQLFQEVRDLWGEEHFILQAAFPKVRLDTDEKENYEKTLDNFFTESLRLQVRRKNKASSSRREPGERRQAGVVSYLFSLPSMFFSLLLRLILAFFSLLGIKSKPDRPGRNGVGRSASPKGQRSSSKKQTKKKRIMRLTDLQAPGANDKKNKYWNGNSTMYGGDGDEGKR